MTANTPGLVEYLSGNPNAPGYRDDHGGANYHDHLAFRDRETTLKAKQALEATGIRVTGFGDRSGHAPNSYHYTDQALDIPGAQWGKGTDKEVFAGSRRVREVLLRTFGRADGEAAPAVSAGSSPGPQPDGTAVTRPSAAAEPVPSALSEMAPLPRMAPIPESAFARSPLPALTPWGGRDRLGNASAVNGLGGSMVAYDSRPTLSDLMGLTEERRQQAQAPPPSALRQVQQMLWS